MNITRRDGLFHAAVNGLEVWMSYALVEYVVCAAAPMLLHREKFLDEAGWRGTAILFVIYGVWGIIMGLLAGLSMDAARDLPLVEFERRSRKLIILLMLAAFGGNLALLPAQSGKAAALLTVPLVAIAVIFDLGKAASNPGFPAAVAGTLVLSARLAVFNWKNLPALMTVPLTLLAASASLLAAVLAIRLASRLASKVCASRFWSPVLEHGVIAAATLTIVFGPGAVSSINAQMKTSAPPATAGKPRPNIILITLDTVRADHMGIYGYARQNTPNLKELLKESTLYTDFVSASTITLTSHASIFTGQYPQTHGAYKQFHDYPHGRPLPKGIPTMASLLNSAGYRSMAVAANTSYLGPDWGLLRDFEASWTPAPLGLVDAPHAYLLRSLLGDMLQDQPAANNPLYSSETMHADGVNRRAFLLLDRFSGHEAPFFLFLNYMDAHWPYYAPGLFDAYPGRDDQFTGNEKESNMRIRIDCEGQLLPRGYHDHVVSQYDGAIAFLDFQIGELVQHLKKSGLFERTMIIITSDHGEALGDRGSVSHNVSVHQDQIHVPLIIKYPGRGGPSRVGDLAGHIDLLPTILEVAGLAPQPQLPGVSLLRLNSTPERVIFAERHYGPSDAFNPRFPEVQYAVYQGSSKLISSSSGGRELYDLANDPDETANLYATDRPLALEGALREWIRRTPSLSAAQHPLDQEEMKHLRSLGYLQ
ncbi:MAG TPA: sulfatase [Candidatus Acidoferrales bacterium]|jgi:arylsulfatase A-like enzyme|nr:sulfatase [Candidatus Acidoferrales bacterium]